MSFPCIRIKNFNPDKDLVDHANWTRLDPSIIFKIIHGIIALCIVQVNKKMYDSYYFNLSKVIKFYLNYFVSKKLVICHTNRTVRNLEISVEQATITDLEYYSFFRVI